MKVTLELPDDLVKEIRVRAVHERKTFKEKVEELLRRGLATSPMGFPTIEKATNAVLKRRKATTRKFDLKLAGVSDLRVELLNRSNR